VTVAKPGDPVLLSFAFCNKCGLWPFQSDSARRDNLGLTSTVICKDGHYSNCNDFNDLNFGGYDESR